MFTTLPIRIAHLCDDTPLLCLDGGAGGQVKQALGIERSGTLLEQNCVEADDLEHLRELHLLEGGVVLDGLVGGDEDERRLLAVLLDVASIHCNYEKEES